MFDPGIIVEDIKNAISSSNKKISFRNIVCFLIGLSGGIIFAQIMYSYVI